MSSRRLARLLGVITTFAALVAVAGFVGDVSAVSIEWGAPVSHGVLIP